MKQHCLGHHAVEWRGQGLPTRNITPDRAEEARARLRRLQVTRRQRRRELESTKTQTDQVDTTSSGTDPRRRRRMTPGKAGAVRSGSLQWPRECMYICIYIVNHKKRGSLFLTITLANLNRFLYFLYYFNREEILHATVVKFTTSP